MRKDKNDETPEILDAPTDRRTLNVMLGTGKLNQFDQTVRVRHEDHGVMGEAEEHLPLILRIFRFIGGLFFAAGVIGVIAFFLGNQSLAVPMTKIGLGVGVPLWGGLHGLDKYLERRDWIRRMNQK